VFRIGSLKIDSPLVLAPMAGYTDSAARRTARRNGAGLVITEMVSAAGLVRAARKTRSLLAFHAEEFPLGVQIFGKDPDEMAEAARIAQDAGVSLVDINLGCPVKKICGNGAGAALLREPLRVASILEKVRRAVDFPVTIKMRLGWDSGNRDAYREIARVGVASGVDAIALHPRTRAQGFQGTADWTCVARLKEDSPVPVIGSGDIVTPEAACEVLTHGVCDAVMIGRAARGNPWIFSQTLDRLAGRTPGDVPEEERARTVRQHCQWILAHYGKEQGWKKARFLLLHYAKGLPGSGAFRKRMFSVEGERSLEELLREFFPAVPDGGC
jgi:tRNA-dihydrouridine synthase B